MISEGIKTTTSLQEHVHTCAQVVMTLTYSEGVTWTCTGDDDLNVNVKGSHGHAKVAITLTSWLLQCRLGKVRKEVREGGGRRLEGWRWKESGGEASSMHQLFREKLLPQGCLVGGLDTETHSMQHLVIYVPHN